VRGPGQRLDIERLRVLPIDPIADTPQKREVAQALVCDGGAGHVQDRGTSLRYGRRVTERHALFAVVNRTANPVVGAVLRSPLHPLLSRGLALITVTGRRTGRRYTFPVGYREESGRVLINVEWPERKRWWRNLRDGQQVELLIRGSRCEGQAVARGNERTGVTVEVRLASDRPI
jgi:hypothetical protein